MKSNPLHVIFRILPALLVCFALAASAADEGRRVALVIGNDAYVAGPLKNPVNDARAMQRALAGAGFKVILAENANKVALEQGAAEFLQSLGPGDTALFYFAGHAVQIENENLLLPVDFTPGRTVIESKFRSVSLAMIIDYIKRARPKTTIIIVDACRVFPGAESHSLQTGLAIPLNPGKDSYIAFSTSPGTVAGDNPDGRNSWFTEALAQLVSEPGLTIDDVLTRVRLRVESATGGAQTPWSQTSLTSKFYFHPAAAAEAAADEGVAAKWWSEERESERYGDWKDALDLASRIVKQKPGPPLEDEARARMPFLIVRNEARARLDKGDYAGALDEYAKAINLDPFDFDAGFEAADCALLAEQLAKAVPPLDGIRARGPSPLAARAEAMLKEIGKAEPAALAVLSRGAPTLPAVADLFPAFRFGIPDWRAVQSSGRSTAAVEYAALAKQLPPVVASKSPSPPQPDTAAPIDPNSFHIQVATAREAGRDLIVEGFGEIAFTAERPDVGVVLNGTPIARKLPYLARVAAGKYTIKVMVSGQVSAEQQIEVRQGQRVEMAVK